MACLLDALAWDANDPDLLAQFWAGLLGRETEEYADGFVLPPGEGDRAPAIRFLRTTEPKVVPNQLHLDLTSDSVDHMQRTVARALELGGRHLDIGQTPDEGHVVLADPEGNELCVIPPGNNFLAGCGFIGALNCDGSQRVGYFWSEALGWPLVWDQDQETAIQSPDGGPKLAWGGPPVAPKHGKNRLHLDLVPAAGTDQQAEVDRLLALGASRVDLDRGDADRVALADPDGNEFCVLAPR